MDSENYTVVTLALFKANQSVPMKWWTFKDDGPVSVGRSLSNHVVVRNSHVSRRHFELRPIYGTNSTVQWKLVSHGKNGTFLNGQPVSEAMLPDDATLQLAPKGPVMKVYLRDRLPDYAQPLRKQQQGAAIEADAAPSERAPDLPKASVADAQDGASLIASGAAGQAMSAAGGQSDAFSGAFAMAVAEPARGGEASSNIVTDLAEPVAVQSFGLAQGRSPKNCDHKGNQVGNLLCIHCGYPVRVIRSVQNYKLLRLLAQGGMGTTFLAWKSPENEPESAAALTPGQRLVVVKQLNPEMASLPKALELFEREASVLQQMDHPGIPKFLDAFSDEGRSYLVMELVHGQNLEQYVAQTGVASPRQVLEWMQQVCDVLHHLHKQHPPILHRDIKPANLLRQYRDGTIVVVDFGAVKSLAGPMGTRIAAEGYTAPEQEAGNPCIASDLFSVGATLLFLMSRRSPFEFYTGPMGTGELNFEQLPEVTPKLADLIKRLLAEEAGDRPSSAMEVKLALTACLDEY